MNWLAKAVQPSTPPHAQVTLSNLADNLEWLATYGLPSVSKTKSGNGWVAYVAMHIVAPGASADVRSDFGMPSPDAAVDQLVARIKAMALGGNR